ncbi:hypothetical protein FQA39_LY06678 [Lamprigera yunnana]|nr:hypothetical protein FQA39_LY06678 [Lamprigera yunnana]
MMKAIKFGSHIKEIRIHLCSKGASSKGVREFIETNYVSIKKDNPNSPILIRECSGVEPKLWVRYEFGKEACADVTNLPAAEVHKELETLLNKC